MLASLETIPPAQVDYDTSDATYTCSASNLEHFCPSTLVRHDLPRTEQGTYNCAYAAEIVHRLLALTFQQSSAAIFPLDLFASTHAHVDGWYHECCTCKRTNSVGP